MTMRRTISLVGTTVIVLVLTPVASAEPGTSEVSTNAWHSTAAVVTNVVPITSAFVQQRCLTGYIFCKLTFAGFSVVAAGEQVVLGGDIDGARATLGRGFGGDWIVRPSDIATGRTPKVYPEAEGADDADPYLPPI